MLAARQDKVEKSILQLLYNLSGAFAALLVLIGRGSGLYRAVHWFQDEWQRNAAIHELSELTDYYLNDVGIIRDEIDETVDAAVRRLRESRYRPR